MTINTQTSHKNATLFNIKISTLRLDEFLKQINNVLKQNKKISIGHVNIHALNLAFNNLYFHNALNKLDLIICDGYGVLIASQITKQNIPERYTSPDFIHHLCQIVSRQNGSVFLLGAQAGVAERAAAALQKETPGLIIAGTQHGYFDKRFDSVENQAVIEKINQAQPSLLLVAFGMPQQEEWLAENWPHLNGNIALTVGALFDTLAGDIPRAPRWITDHGFEWLARLIIEPKRLWKRYLIGNPLFFWRVIREQSKNSFNSSYYKNHSK